jgi:hypothetical protein
LLRFVLVLCRPKWHAGCRRQQRKRYACFVLILLSCMHGKLAMRLIPGPNKQAAVWRGVRLRSCTLKGGEQISIIFLATQLARSCQFKWKAHSCSQKIQNYRSFRSTSKCARATHVSKVFHILETHKYSSYALKKNMKLSFMHDKFL